MRKSRITLTKTTVSFDLYLFRRLQTFLERILIIATATLNASRNSQKEKELKKKEIEKRLEFLENETERVRTNKCRCHYSFNLLLDIFLPKFCNFIYSLKGTRLCLRRSYTSCALKWSPGFPLTSRNNMHQKFKEPRIISNLV